MLLGEVDESDFEQSNLGMLLFIVFVLLVVILLANVLIAIVTDSYGVIRNERAAIVFWGNRLDFIVEMNVISSGVLRNVGNREEGNQSKEPSNTPSATLLWKQMMDVFDKDLNRIQIWSVQFLCLTCVRVAIIFVVVPLWVVCGFATAGCVWPDQWRKKILEQKITKHTNLALAKSEQQVHELKLLKDDVADLREEVTAKLAANQDVINQLRVDLVTVKNDVAEELREIQEIMNSLFEIQKSQLSPSSND
mmetsp:Transcript_21030/g.30818  ORF Transcript_21030/g.30818 Transcript_21030/m.30818 type:complete len:250 (-) Transcript_21030:238-987(-)